MNVKDIGAHYQLIVRRENFKDNLEIKVELKNGELLESYGRLEELTGEIADRMKSTLGLQAKITLTAPKSLERFSGKAKRIIDLRNVKNPEDKQ